jgi:SMC interacting uncharacterized protein involved in chromosome segregation
MPIETIEQEKARLSAKISDWEHIDSHRNESDEKKAEMASVKMRMRELMLLEKKPSPNQSLENLAKKVYDLDAEVKGLEAKRGWSTCQKRVIDLIYDQIREEEK